MAWPRRAELNGWRCPLCKSREADHLFAAADAMGATPRTFAVVRCRECCLFSLSPRPQGHELLSLYPDDYETFWPPLDEEPNLLARWMRRRHYALRCCPVRRAYPAGGQLLDVGCGTGGFLRELCRDGNWQGMGVDINESVLSVACHQGVDVLCGELRDARFPTACFDVVTMWDVIEHILDFQETLTEVRRVLKPEGKLLLSTPNGESWQARLWGSCWAGWDVPRHLQVFSPQTLCRLLEDVGFEPVRRLSLPMERFFAVESARRWLRVRVGGSARHVAQRLASLMGLAAWPTLRWIDGMPSASSMVLEARAISR
jgi:SAM-dependent methyltransferase